MPIDLMANTTTKWYINPAWWQVAVTFLSFLVTVLVAWNRLDNLNDSVKEVNKSVKKIIQVEGGVYTTTGSNAKMSVGYTAKSIKTRYEDEKNNVEDILDIIHDSLIERVDKIDKETMRSLVNAAVDIVDKIDTEKNNLKRKQ